MQKALKQYEFNLTNAKVTSEEELENLNSAVEMERTETRAQKRARAIQSRQLKKELET